MGCDIHVKTYLWSKVENRYVDLFEVLEKYSIEGERRFPDIVGDRFYDLFGAFGNSGRSWYPEMGSFHCGVPPFLSEGTLMKILENQGGNYGYEWIFLPDLKREILKYIRKLKDPDLYYEDKDDDTYLDYKDGYFSKKDFEKNNSHVISGLREVRRKALLIEKSLKESCFKGVFNVKKTIFFIWFDN